MADIIDTTPRLHGPHQADRLMAGRREPMTSADKNNWRANIYIDPSVIELGEHAGLFKLQPGPGDKSLSFSAWITRQIQKEARGKGPVPGSNMPGKQVLPDGSVYVVMR